MKLKKSVEDLKIKIKTSWREMFVWHIIRNITLLLYYSIFAYVVYKHFISVEIVSSRVKIAFSGLSILIVTGIILFFRILRTIRDMEKGYLRITFNGLFSCGFLFAFSKLFDLLQKYSINLSKFFMFLAVMGVVKLGLLLLDNFVYSGYKLDWEEKKELDK